MIIQKLLLVFLLFPLFCFAQDADFFKPDSVRKILEATAITSSIHIDGILNEPEWRLAKPSPRFTQIEPYQGKPPNFETTVKVLYNKRYLYFGMIAYDSLGKKAIRAIDFKRDFDYQQHDLLSLAFDAFNDKRNAMLFATNAYGVQRDLLAFDDLYYDIDWDGLWEVRTNRTDSGWTAEMAIPWQTLRYPKTKDSIQQWGFNMYRNRRLTNEVTAFSPFPRSFSAVRMDYAGLLTNLQPPPPTTNIRVQPYALISYDEYKGYDSLGKAAATKFKTGGEIKWAINPNAVLDVTANTDFAQTDVDEQVNNTSRFSVFFPEKRQFFLENASLFGVGISQNDDGSGGSMQIQPFFSRRIGLDDNGNAIPIEAGGRFVYRSSKMNYGAIAIRQQSDSSEPATNFFIGRFSENIGRQNRIGGLVTIKNNALGTNVVSTADGFFRIGDAQSINAMLMQSVTTNTKQQGFAGIAQYYYTTNQIKIWWTESVVTKNFDPAVGFVSTTDVVSTTPGIFYYYRGKHLPLKKWLLSLEPGLLGEFYHQASTGQLLQRNFSSYPVYLNFKSGAFFGYGGVYSYQRLTEPFAPLNITIATGEYNYLQQQLLAGTDPSKVINVQGEYDWGGYFNGKLRSGNVQLQVAPIPYISLTGNFNRDYFMNVGETKTTAKINLYSITARLALNPRIQLTGLYQKNTEDNSVNYNIRFSWEYKPLAYIYLVFNRQGIITPQTKLTADHAIAKLSYLKQF